MEQKYVKLATAFNSLKYTKFPVIKGILYYFFLFVQCPLLAMLVLLAIAFLATKLEFVLLL